jgi:hypothetical protein
MKRGVLFLSLLLIQKYQTMGKIQETNNLEGDIPSSVFAEMHFT